MSSSLEDMFNFHKKIYYVGFLSLLIVITTSFSTSFASSIEGTKCSKEASKKIVKSVNYYCDYQNGNLKWWRDYSLSPLPKQKTNKKAVKSSPKPSVAYKSYEVYKAAFQEMLETSEEELRVQGFFKIFGVNGQPVRSKAENYCKWRQVMLPPFNTTINHDQMLGCADAAMTIYLK